MRKILPEILRTDVSLNMRMLKNSGGVLTSGDLFIYLGKLHIKTYVDYQESIKRVSFINVPDERLRRI